MFAPLLILAAGLAAGWELQAASGPAARSLHAMAYDPARGEVVLFGGIDEVAPLDDTWTYSGQWTSKAPAVSPPPRWGHALAADPRRERVVLFGGVTATAAFSAETWEWDGSTWALVASDGPPGRWGHSLSFDDQTQRVVLFGGLTAGGDDAAVWEWDGSLWRERESTSGPAARHWHAATKVSDGLFVHGGLGTATFNDVWLLSGSTWTTLDVGADVPGGFAISAASNGTLVIVVGGGAAPWSYDFAAQTWNDLEADGPQRVGGSSIVHDDGNSHFLLFGGAVDGTPTGDTWVFTTVGAAATDDVVPGGCGCRTGDAPSFTALGLLALMLRRRLRK